MITLPTFGTMFFGSQTKSVTAEAVQLVRIILVVAAVFVVTLPFGFYRAYTRKLSLRWFLAIHVPVVFAFLIRFGSHVPWTFIPFTVVAFAAAQLLGVRAGRWWMGRHVTAPAPNGQKV